MWNHRDKSSGVHAFQSLLKLGIYPTQEDLGKCSSLDNTNVWHILAGCGDQYVPIFLELLDLGIHPTQEDLAQCRTSNNENVWRWLASSNERSSIFQKLLDLGIHPTQEDLGKCSSPDNTNTWYWLSINTERIPIFQKLLDLGIHPTQEDLGKCSSSYNTNAWHWLASSTERISVFQKLLDLGIYPTQEDLAKCSTKDNTNAWYWLSKDVVGTPVLQMLIEKNILPDTESLKNVGFRGKICRLDQINDFNSKYNIKPGSKVAFLLSREDHLDFYGFLYLFCWLTANNKEISKLPIEIWYLIGQQVSPYFNALWLEELAFDENRLAFIKYHIINSLNAYLNSNHAISSMVAKPIESIPHVANSFFNPIRTFLSSAKRNINLLLEKPITIENPKKLHEERAESLQLEVKNRENPSPLLKNQFLMSYRLNKTYLNAPHQKYEEPFTKNVEDENFKTILMDGWFLNFKAK